MNASAPAATIPTNTTAAFGAGLGGNYLETATLAAGTDGIVQAAANSSAVTAAAVYLISGWVKTEVAATDFRLAVDWYQTRLFKPAAVLRPALAGRLPANPGSGKAPGGYRF